MTKEGPIATEESGLPPARPLAAANPGAGTTLAGSVAQAVHGRRSVR